MYDRKNVAEPDSEKMYFYYIVRCYCGRCYHSRPGRADSGDCKQCKGAAGKTSGGVTECSGMDGRKLPYVGKYAQESRGLGDVYKRQIRLFPF